MSVITAHRVRLLHIIAGRKRTIPLKQPPPPRKNSELWHPLEERLTLFTPAVQDAKGDDVRPQVRTGKEDGVFSAGQPAKLEICLAENSQDAGRYSFKLLSLYRNDLRLRSGFGACKRLPKRVLVFRDGDQFTVVAKELPAIIAAFKQFDTLQAPYRPKLSIIVCGKEHHARFSPAERSAAEPQRNPQPGTVVDRGVTVVYGFNYFLRDRGGLQGTTRPTRYHVVRDEIGFRVDKRQSLTNTGGYMFARATNAVGLFSPAYYADRACNRGRRYLHKLSQGFPNGRVATPSTGKNVVTREETTLRASPRSDPTKTTNHVRRPPHYEPAFSTHIAVSRDEAMGNAERLDDSLVYRAYCDGSGFEGGVGAAAVLYNGDKKVKSLKYHLGAAKDHTVYEAEAVGVILAFHLLTGISAPINSLPCIIGVDNQTVIQDLNKQQAHPGAYLLDVILILAEDLQSRQDALRRYGDGTLKTRGVCQVEVHWVPGHEGFRPNERADKEAKSAAEGDTSADRLLPVFLRNGPLPANVWARK